MKLDVRAATLAAGSIAILVCARGTLDDKQAKLEELEERRPHKVTMDDKFLVTKFDAKSKKK
jgi:hypothetical protein